MTHRQMTEKVAGLKTKLETVEKKVAEIEATEGTHKEWESLNDLYDQEYDLEQEVKRIEISYRQHQALKAGASGRTNNIR